MTAPFGSPTTTVRAEYGARPAGCAKATLPSAGTTSPHGRLLPTGPAKQACCVEAPGSSTVAVAARIGACHSAPMAFQYSSSWSSNALSAPSTV